MAVDIIARALAAGGNGGGSLPSGGNNGDILTKQKEKIQTFKGSYTKEELINFLDQTPTGEFKFRSEYTEEELKSFLGDAEEKGALNSDRNDMLILIQKIEDEETNSVSILVGAEGTDGDINSYQFASSGQGFESDGWYNSEGEPIDPPTIGYFNSLSLNELENISSLDELKFLEGKIDQKGAYRYVTDTGEDQSVMVNRYSNPSTGELELSVDLEFGEASDYRSYLFAGSEGVTEDGWYYWDSSTGEPVKVEEVPTITFLHDFVVEDFHNISSVDELLFLLASDENIDSATWSSPSEIGAGKLIINNIEYKIRITDDPSDIGLDGYITFVVEGTEE